MVVPVHSRPAESVGPILVGSTLHESATLIRGLLGRGGALLLPFSTLLRIVHGEKLTFNLKEALQLSLTFRHLVILLSEHLVGVCFFWRCLVGARIRQGSLVHINLILS